MKILLAFFSVLLLAAFNWQTKPIEMIVPFGAGGPTDIVARHIEKAIESAGLEVAIINRAGAAGNIGMAAFIQKEKSLLVATESILSNKENVPSSYPNGIVESARLVKILGRSPYILYANQKFSSMEELITFSQTSGLWVGSSSIGSGSHRSYKLLCETFKILSNCRVVLYASASSGILDMLSNRTDVYFSLPSAFNQFTSLETVRPLVVLSNTRTTVLPHVPAINEFGIYIENYTWQGLFYKGLTEKEERLIKKAVNSYFTIEMLASLGVDQLPMTSEEFWINQLKEYNFK